MGFNSGFKGLMQIIISGRRKDGVLIQLVQIFLF